MQALTVARVTWTIAANAKITGFGVTLSDGSRHIVVQDDDIDEGDSKTYIADIKERIERIRVYQNWLSRSKTTFLKAIVLCTGHHDRVFLEMGAHSGSDLCSNFKIGANEHWIGFEAEVDDKSTMLNLSFLKWTTK